MPTIYQQRVNINGFDFNAGSALPAGALAWGIDVCDGWKNTPDPDVRVTPYGASRDGSSSADFFAYPQRFITLGGWAYAPDDATAESLNDMLLRDIMPRNKEFQLTRYEATPKYITCRRASAFETDWTAVETGFRWQVTLAADDPLKYALDLSTDGAGVSGNLRYVRVGALSGGYSRTYPIIYTSTGGDGGAAGIINYGTAPSSQVVVTLSGPLATGAWRIRNDTNNGELSFNIGIASTDVMVINFSNQTAFLNGYPVAYNITGDFWTVDPGPNTIRLYADYDPATHFTVSARSAWE
jgi:hypothetical protein